MAIDEGGALIGAPRPLRNAGPSFRVERIASHFRVISTPYPVHWAIVLKTHVSPGWLVVVESARVTPRRFGPRELSDALSHAGIIIGALYRVDMRSRFTGPQRYAMGRNLCPYRVPCPPGVGCPDLKVGHYHLCKKAPDGPRTVFCEAHAETIERPGDAFNSLDDSRGGG